MSIRIEIILVILVMIVSGCEPESDLQCFPQRISTKGDAGATSITADYKYEGDILDHIIQSNYQTHIYTYNHTGQLINVTRKNVQTFQKREFELLYDDGLVSRRDDYLMSLSRTTQEDLDTTFVGYVEYDYNGDEVIAEKVFTIDNHDGEMELKFYKEYEYDLMGNIISYLCLDDLEGDTIDAFQYTYDTHKNPFSSIKMLFEGKSYVNNITETKDVFNDQDYVHKMGYTVTDFPEQIIIAQGSINLEITSISYTCK